MKKVRYKYGDTVSFIFANDTYVGTIEIIDAHGTFEQHEEPSYDIMGMYKGSKCLFKHVRQSYIHNNNDTVQRIINIINTFEPGERITRYTDGELITYELINKQHVINKIFDEINK